MLKESLMLTDDENIIDIQFAVQYFLSDPADYLFNNRMPDENVRQAAETAIREVVGKSKMDFVLYEGREQVAASATNLIQEILDRYKSGILISKLTMQNAQPPEQVQAAFDDAVKAGQDRERQKNEGQAYANDVVPRAKGAAARLMQEADGYKQRVIANAEGDASRFKQILVEYEKAPQVTRERMYQDMMQQVMGNVSKVMVDQKNGNSLLYLPLTSWWKAHALAVRQRRRWLPPSLHGQAITPRRSAHGIRCSAATGGTLMNKSISNILIGAVAALVLLSMSVFVVDQRQNAIVFQLGEVVGLKTAPGLNFKVPLLQNVRFFDSRILTLDTVDPERFITSEKKNVLVDSFVKWRIVDVKQYYVSVGGDEIRARRVCCRRLTPCAKNSASARSASGVRRTRQDHGVLRTKADADARKIGVEVLMCA
jgi:HflK protein